MTNSFLKEFGKQIPRSVMEVSSTFSDDPFMLATLALPVGVGAAAITGYKKYKTKQEMIEAIMQALPSNLGEEEKRSVAEQIVKKAKENDMMDTLEVLAMYRAAYGDEALTRLALEARQELNKEAAGPSFRLPTKDEYDDTKSNVSSTVNDIKANAKDMYEKAVNTGEKLKNDFDIAKNKVDAIPGKSEEIATNIARGVDNFSKDVPGNSVKSINATLGFIDDKIKASLPEGFKPLDPGPDEPNNVLHHKPGTLFSAVTEPKTPQGRELPLVEPEDLKPAAKITNNDKLDSIKDAVLDKAIAAKDAISDVVSDNPGAAGVAAGAAGVLGLGLLGKGVAKAIAKKKIPKEVLAAINEEMVDEIMKHADTDLDTPELDVSNTAGSIFNSSPDIGALTRASNLLGRGENDLLGTIGEVDSDSKARDMAVAGTGAAVLGVHGINKAINKIKMKKKAEAYVDYITKVATVEYEE